MKKTTLLLMLVLAMPSTKELGTIDVHFCAVEDCEEILANAIGFGARSVDCAQYSFDDGPLMRALDKSSARVRLVTDRREKLMNKTYARHARTSALMHDKFCVIDDTLITTGSFNPGSAHEDDNNLVLIDNRILANRFADEFEELWERRENRAGNVDAAEIDGAMGEVLFCPEEGCAARLIHLIASANKSVRLMTFSFTHPEVITELILAHHRNVTVQGVLESRQSENKETYARFIAQEMDVRFDGNPGIMHHKVFIIDEEIAIFGSFNPTRNGDRNNDENMVVVRDAEIARVFISEFSRVWGCAALPKPPACP